MDRVQRWSEKFRHAFRGLREGARGQNSLFVHAAAAIAVAIAAALLQATPVEWGVLLLCVTVVLAAEWFNSALESIALAITDRHDPHLRDALDIASAAVLIASFGAAIVGAILFLHRAGLY